MEDKKLYELMDKFEASSMTLFELEHEGMKIRMERAVPQAPVVIPAAAPAVAAAPAAPAPASETANTEAPKEAPANNYVPVKAPLVGVFYAAPSPTDAPYVELGQRVEAGQVLCLVEAMKMMNELTSPVNGIIRAIHGQNEALVEYDQVLFEVEEC